MKQLTLTEVLKSLDEGAMPIGERLESLGFSQDDLAGIFSNEILQASVYGSSFLKFLNENKSKLSFDEDIPAEELPADFKNAFEDGGMTIGERLAAMDVDTGEMFSADILDLNVNGEEFQEFLLQNQEKFLAKLEELAAAEGATNG